VTAFLLLLLTALPLHAGRDPLGTIEGTRDRMDDYNRVSLGLRGGPAFLLGGVGKAYRPAAAFGLLLDVPFSDYAGFTVDAEHALHRMDDANPLFWEAEHVFDLEAVSGTQRHFNFDLGFRIGFGVNDESRAQVPRVTALPWFRLAMGVTFTRTLLDLPGLSGPQQLQSRAPHLCFAPGFGVAVRLPKVVTIQPSIKAVSLIGLDHNEVVGNDEIRSVWRLQPSLDVLFRI